jgi:hypothetical protein
MNRRGPPEDSRSMTRVGRVLVPASDRIRPRPQSACESRHVEIQPATMLRIACIGACPLSEDESGGRASDCNESVPRNTAQPTFCAYQTSVPHHHLNWPALHLRAQVRNERELGSCATLDALSKIRQNCLECLAETCLFGTCLLGNTIGRQTACRFEVPRTLLGLRLSI